MGDVLAPSKPPSVEVPDPVEMDAQEEERRKQALARARRGRASTIATSHSGLLALTPVAAQRKSLLGE
jgi:hypothetical protein